MSTTSLILLLFAAVLHAIANALIKQARDKLAFTWWTLGVSSILGLPIWLSLRDVNPDGWPVVLFSGVLEAVYFIALTRAYSHGDLSQVYPIARGSAPLFTTLWAIAFLSERPSTTGFLGILSVVIGLYVINLRSLADWNQPLLGFKSPATRWAVLTGVLISAYSTVDKVGMRYFDPFTYLYLILFVGWLALTPQWLIAERRAALFAEVQPASDTLPMPLDGIHLGWWFKTHPGAVIGAGALFGLSAYVLVLTALQLSAVSYVSSVREISVVIGAWIGIRFMDESGGALRVLASLFVVTGVLLIAFGG
ncbi:MAG TPA: EamA family transporter [Anaerolineae bacterium]|nr:EamA family transporter [Anaerolineae bacterium]